MIAAEDCALVLLAAGLSRRFGGSKLDADLWGRPLGLHVVEALAVIPFGARVAVTGRYGIDYAAHGYEVVANDDPGAGMGRSVGLGVARARMLDVKAVVIALADMPRVTAAHVRRLMDVADGSDAVVASDDGRGSKPPALFGIGQFGVLADLSGDRGARDLLRAGNRVATTPAELIDVDTLAELEQLRGRSPRGE